MNEKNMLNYYCDVVEIAMYIMSRIPTGTVHGLTPKEKFAKRKPYLSHLKVFGCIAYVHIPNEKRTKLDPKTKDRIFIGYSLLPKGNK